MALTRSFLKGMGITDEQISAIIEAHTESTDALKAQRDAYKEDAEKLPNIQRELDDLKKSGGDWKSKYEEEHSAYESYKSEQQKIAVNKAKEDAYRKLIKDAGVSDKRIDAIMRVTDLASVDFTDGKISGADEIKESIKKEWSDFIVQSATSGATTPNPSGSSQLPDYDSMTDEEYYKSISKK